MGLNCCAVTTPRGFASIVFIDLLSLFRPMAALFLVLFLRSDVHFPTSICVYAPASFIHSGRLGRRIRGGRICPPRDRARFERETGKLFSAIHASVSPAMRTVLKLNPALPQKSLTL